MNAPAKPTTPRATCVLLVEDSAEHLDRAEDLLRSFGLVVEAARHGAKAVDLALRRPYALILMDLQMPVMDGLSATRRIRQALGPKLPIVALTARGSAADRRACELAGMNDHLSKPVDAASLHSTLERWLPPGSLRPWPLAMPPGAAAANAPCGPQSAAEAAMTERLSAVEGFDLAGSLRNLNGQLPRLQRVLRRFADAYRLGEPALQAVLNGPDLALGQQLCHSLRGACASICATALVRQIQQLEAALSIPADAARLQTSIQALQSELVGLAQALDSALTRGGG